MSRIDQIRHRTVELAQLAALGLAVAACPASAQHDMKHGNKPEAKPSASQPEAKAKGQLAEQLRAMSAQFEQSAPPEMVKTFTEAIERLEASGILENVKDTGDTAPAFELADAKGSPVSLSALLAEGPVVLTFYRGGWCPYCNIQLRAYQENLEAIQALGANLVAISPELPDNTLTTAEKNELAFTILSDPGNEVADAFGLRYEIDPVLAERFAPMLESTNGDASHTLPLTATYVIDQEGVIRYASVTVDYKERAEPAEILKALEHVRKGH